MDSQNNISQLAQYNTATPYLAVFNDMGMPVNNPLTGIPLGAYITSFSYTYDLKKENQASLTIETGNPDTVDIAELQSGKTIFLQWGYIFPNGQSISSPVKAIQVKDLNAVFDQNGTKVTLKCVDGVSNLRHVPGHAPNDKDDDETLGMVAFMDNGCGVGMGIIIEKF